VESVVSCHLWFSSSDSLDLNHRFHGWAQIQKDKDPNGLLSVVSVSSVVLFL
jgi:hypothetical protein